MVNSCIVADNMKKIKKFEGMTPMQTSITFWLLRVHMFSILKSCNWKNKEKGKYQKQKGIWMCEYEFEQLLSINGI